MSIENPCIPSVKYDNDLRTVIFKALEWQIEETDEEFFIYCTGMTSDRKSVMIRIDNFCPFVYVELPELSTGEWTDAKLDAFIEYVVKKCGDNAPVFYDVKAKRSVMRNEPSLFIRMCFKTPKQCRQLEYKFTREIYIPGFPFKFKENEFKVHEGNIEPLIKFTTMRKIELSGWIEAKEYIPEEETDNDEEGRKFTTADIDLYVNWKDVKPVKDVPESIDIDPKILSMDIEQYSANHNSTQPDTLLDPNCIIQISNVISRKKEPIDSYKKYLLTLLESDPIPDTQIREYGLSEKNLLLGFNDLVNEENPDIIIGYNFLKYDYDAMIKRASQILGIGLAFRSFGRIIGKKVPVVEKNWQSSAYGVQKFSYLAPQGRLNIDIIQEIERNNRLDTYKLGAVATKFLEETKEDLPIIDMFKLFQASLEIFILLKSQKELDKIIEKDEKIGKIFSSNIYALKDSLDDDNLILQKIKERIHIIIGKYNEFRLPGEFKKKILSASSIDELYSLMRQMVKKIGDYNVQDSVLPLKLLKKLYILEGLSKMSDICCIPMSYLQTRGQQIKILAQIYSDVMFGNYVVPHKKYFGKIIQKYQGATVKDPIPGSTKKVAVFDFQSLYPTIIIAHNICWSTYKEADDPISNEECIVISWEDHYGCDHDKTKRKTKIKKEDSICSGEPGVKKVVRFAKHTIDENGVFHNQGIMPRKLTLLLKARADVRKKIEMLKITLAMNNGDEKAIQKAKTLGIPFIKKNSLSKKEISDILVSLVVLDKLQLALKISANSGYGGYGSEMSYLPLIDAAAAVTAKGREMISYIGSEVEKNYGLKVLYGDTDSIMVDVSHMDLKEIYEFGEKFSKEITKKLPKPMKLEFESIYQDYMILSKKRYFANKIDEKGNIVETVKKGIVLTRRDNCHFLKDVYGKMVEMIKKDETHLNVMRELYDMINCLFTRNACLCCKTKYPDSKFVLFKGIKNVEDYDEEAHVSHVMLARKMIKRGVEVAPNTRLEFLFLKDKTNKIELQGEKAEDFTYFRDNKRRLGLQIDPLYYLDHQLCKPLTELLNVKYPPKKVIYKPTYDAIFEYVIKDKSLRNITYKSGRIFDLSETWYSRKLSKDGKKEMGARYPPAEKEKIINIIYKDVKKNLSAKHNDLKVLLSKWSYEQVITKLRKKFGLKRAQKYKPKKGEDFLLVDQYFMWDILEARTNYEEVVKEIKKLSRIKIKVKEPIKIKVKT